MLTGANDESMGIRAVGEGAQDYLVKGQADDRVLARSLLYAVERQRSEEVSRQLYQVHGSGRRTPGWSGPCCRLRWCPPTRDAVGRLPAGGNEGELGGDFYDAVELGDGALRIVIGDVSGHGPDEAALGAALRGAWRALVLAGARRPPMCWPRSPPASRTERPDASAFVTLCMVSRTPDRRTAGSAWPVTRRRWW